MTGKKQPHRRLDLIHLNTGHPCRSYSDVEGCKPCVKPANDAETTMATSKITMNNITTADDMAVLKHLAGKA